MYPLNSLSSLRFPLCLMLFLVCLGGTRARGGDIALFYALEADWQRVSEDLEVTNKSLKGRVVQTVMIGLHQVWAVQMGVGNVETAMQASNLLEAGSFDLAVAIGPGGSLTDELKTGDLLLVDSVTAYQRGTWSSTGWAMSNASVFALSIPEVTPGSALWAELPKKRLASGEVFIASDSQRRRLAVETKACMVDMNSYGLAAACARFKVPLLNVKICSDHANDNASADFAEFIASYDGKLGKIVRKWIGDMPLSSVDPQSYDKIREILKGEERDE